MGSSDTLGYHLDCLARRERESGTRTEKAGFRRIPPWCFPALCRRWGRKIEPNPRSGCPHGSLPASPTRGHVVSYADIGLPIQFLRYNFCPVPRTRQGKPCTHQFTRWSGLQATPPVILCRRQDLWDSVTVFAAGKSATAARSDSEPGRLHQCHFPDKGETPHGVALEHQTRYYSVL